ncbi:hypothetical protein EPO44_14485, partial [bacterium]
MAKPDGLGKKQTHRKKLTPHEQYIRLRNRAIRSLRDGGWGVLEIAEVFRMHKGSVSRVYNFGSSPWRVGENGEKT